MQFDPSTVEGSVWFIIVISIIAAIGISIIKILITKAVETFVIKKRENEDEIKQEVSKASVLIFVILSALILIWQKDNISHQILRSQFENQMAVILISHQI